MPNTLPKRPLSLSGNALKLIAAAAMLIDHTGMLLFPDALWMRIVGRLAFPIFAFMIAEGCRYTRSRRRYLGLIAVLAALYQIVYWLFDRSTYMSVLVTFTLAILVIYALQHLKSTLAEKNRTVLKTACAILLLLSSVAGVWLANRFLTIDYGFWGCMLPVWVSIFQPRRGDTMPPAMARFDILPVHIAMLSVGLFILGLDLGAIQMGALTACPLLLLYSGQRGTLNMKYFFYIFYPVHLAVLQGLAMVIW